MSNRNVLFFDPDRRLKSVSQHSGLTGWDTVVAIDKEHATRLMEIYRFRTGVVFLSGFESDHEINAIRQWIEGVAYETGIQTEWIALLPSGGFSESDGICRLIKTCCYDYHTLPVDWNRLEATLGHAHGMAALSPGHAEGDLGVSKDEKNKSRIVWKSPAMRKLHQKVTRFAISDATGLIRGESGTGKELLAETIHYYSPRSEGPFVPVKCGALSAQLNKSRLLDGEQDPLENLPQMCAGLFESADGGTLFLDEIGDLAMEMQVNLLHFLDQGKDRDIEGRVSSVADMRIIAATDSDLQSLVSSGRFRSDLFYRLNIVNLSIPPLREREEDIEPLALHFLDRFSGETQRRIKGFSLQALQVMQNYYWPGNVRELINRVRRAIIMCEKSLINPADLGLEARTIPRRVQRLVEARADAEKKAINTALKRTGNNVSQAARDLGIARRTLYHLKEKHSIA